MEKNRWPHFSLLFQDVEISFFSFLNFFKKNDLSILQEKFFPKNQIPQKAASKHKFMPILIFGLTGTFNFSLFLPYCLGQLFLRENDLI